MEMAKKINPLIDELNNLKTGGKSCAVLYRGLYG